MEQQLKEYDINNHVRVEGIDGKELDFEKYRDNHE